MARCGCASNVCTCTITGGVGVQVSGTGTSTDPYILGAQPTVLQVADSASVDLTLTGNGSEAAPYLIRADLATTPNPGGNVPAGCILDFGAAVAPTGWKICDGSAIARVEFSALFAVIGTTYGAGDGSTTFNLPDCRSRFTIGSGSGAGLTPRTLAAKGGQQDAVVVSHNHGSHTHTGGTGTETADHAHSGSTAGEGGHVHNGSSVTVQGGGGTSVLYAWPDTNTGTGNVAATRNGYGNHGHGFSTGGRSAAHGHGFTTDGATPTGSGVTGTDQNLPPFIALNKIIKT
jgi:microcystin-dependent protein